jgi:hypothetical protein
MLAPLVVLGVFYSVFACAGAGGGWFFSVFGLDFSGLLPTAVTEAFATASHEIHERMGAAGWLFSLSVVEQAGAPAPRAVWETSSWSMALLLLGVLIPVGGIAAASWFYKKTPQGDTLREKFPRLYAALEYRWMDTLYDAWVAKVQQPFANAVGFLDTLLVNGLAVRAIGAGIPALLGLASRRLFHTGDLSGYLRWFALGALCYGAVLLFF